MTQVLNLFTVCHRVDTGDISGYYTTRALAKEGLAQAGPWYEIREMTITIDPPAKEFQCPDCESRMVVRANRKTGVEFLGYSEYPQCTGSRSRNGVDTSQGRRLAYETDYCVTDYFGYGGAFDLYDPF